MPLLHVDDAIDHLVQFLAREIIDTPRRVFTPTSETKYGCDLWIPNIVRAFWRSRDSAYDTLNRDQLRQYYQPFYDAAWELCRIGVLRPGEITPAVERQGVRGFGGDGYSLTLFGSRWVQKAAAERPLIDPGRYGEVTKPFTDRFGVGLRPARNRGRPLPSHKQLSGVLRYGWCGCRIQLVGGCYRQDW
jgi:hypothetical protein